MKERPILFSGEMVRAILDGRKTMTRRIVKPTPWEVIPPRQGEAPWPYAFDFYAGSTTNGTPRKMICPYSQPGDQLWVRETFRFSTPDDCACYEPCSCKSGLPIYRATTPDPQEYKWKPSIFMPRWASRITLEVTRVAVERVQDISEADAIAEGVTWPRYDDDLEPVTIGNITTGKGRIAFKELWDSINSKRGYGWHKNPWVWAITFKRIQ